jgi:hypothetical protein
MYRELNANNCTFEGVILVEPILNQNDTKPVLEIVLKNVPILNSSTEFNIHLRAYGQYALTLYPQIAREDKIRVECMYLPQRVLGMENTIFPKFNISRLTILEKKLSDFKYDYKESNT